MSDDKKADPRLDLYDRSPPLPEGLDDERPFGTAIGDQGFPAEEAKIEIPAEELKKALEEEVVVKLERLHPNARVPERKTAGAAAADVYAVKDTELKPGETTPVGLGIKVAIPEGYELVLVPRSGLSCKGVVVRNSPGTIDSDYRGEVMVILKHEPENLCQAVSKAYKILFEFAKNLVTTAAFDTARSRLMDHVKNDPLQPYTIKAGDRIGQLKLHKVIPHSYQEVDSLDETERGDGGLGSTGR
jgi:dUTP pyrophosphatase